MVIQTKAMWKQSSMIRRQNLQITNYVDENVLEE